MRTCGILNDFSLSANCLWPDQMTHSFVLTPQCKSVAVWFNQSKNQSEHIWDIVDSFWCQSHDRKDSDVQSNWWLICLNCLFLWCFCTFLFHLHHRFEPHSIVCWTFKVMCAVNFFSFNEQCTLTKTSTVFTLILLSVFSCTISTWTQFFPLTTGTVELFASLTLDCGPLNCKIEYNQIWVYVISQFHISTMGNVSPEPKKDGSHETVWAAITTRHAHDTRWDRSVSHSGLRCYRWVFRSVVPLCFCRGLSHSVRPRWRMAENKRTRHSLHWNINDKNQ